MNIRYVPSQLDEGQQDMNKGATLVDDILVDLGAQIRPLVERFVGASASAYYASQTRWDQKAAELNGIFAQAAAQVGRSTNDMVDTDRSGSGRFHAV